MKQPFELEQISHQLLQLGVRPGGVLVVHCAFSQVKPVVGGPLGLIAGLRAALGPQGTLVMPSLPDDDEQPFDPHLSPCIGMGVVAQSFWQQPGVYRSDSPHAFAAQGPAAALITAPQPLDIPHGIDSPVGRAYEQDGQVLLIGVGHDSNTTLHLAEFLAGVRYRRMKNLMILQDGQPRPYTYFETDHCCQKFALMDKWLEAEHLQSFGPVGHAHARLADARAIISVALSHLRQEEAVFLHPFGVDDECDEARRSLEGAQ